MRPLLALLLLGLAAAYLGVGPAQAAKPDNAETVVTYRGFTVSWSGSDPSDFRVSNTPGRSESFPASAGDRSIQHAKALVNSAAEQASEESTDSCNFVPDSFGEADFTMACDTHDTCYSSSTDRLVCDLALLAGLRAACADAYPAGTSLRLTCYAVAGIYFVGVRLFGASFYSGTGSRA
ncbi:MAG TPA: hypothetical protein VNT27_04065 [Propionibacteriaceae bacterium]|nr:hypothetical protein [Propionibacteriaceae bacterium]